MLRPGWGHLFQQWLVRTKAPKYPRWSSQQPCSLSQRGRQAGPSLCDIQARLPAIAQGVGGSLHKPCPVASPAGAGTNPFAPCVQAWELTTLRARKWGETESPRAPSVHFPGPLRAGRVCGSRDNRSSVQHLGQGLPGRRGPAHRAQGQQGACSPPTACGAPEPGGLGRPVVSAPGAPPAATPQLFPGLEA